MLAASGISQLRCLEYESRTFHAATGGLATPSALRVVERASLSYRASMNTSRRPPAFPLAGPTTPSFSIRSTSFAALL